MKPDGASLVPLKGGKVLVWDVMCASILAPSNAFLAMRETGAVGRDKEYSNSQLQVGNLSSSYSLFHISLETLGVLG